MIHLLDSLAHLAGGLFAGASLYVIAVAHPVRASMAPDQTLLNFRRSLGKSERIMPALHVVTLLTTAGLTWKIPSISNVTALVLLAPILPLSIGVIMPINTALRDPALDSDPANATLIFQRWIARQTIRAVLGILAFAAICY